MAKGFMKLRYSVSEKKDEELREIGTRGLRSRGFGRARGFGDRSLTFNSNESAARFYLGKVLEKDNRSLVRGMSAPETTELAPEFRVTRTQETSLTKTRLVQFNQTKNSIPVFGARVNVELDENRELVNVTGDVADIKGVSPIPAISPKDALSEIEEFTESKSKSLEKLDITPELVFFHKDETDTWHLAYYFRKIPAAPKSFVENAYKKKSQGHGFSDSPRERNPLLNYLVDAHNGKILFYYSAVPLVAIPIKCKGCDEEGLEKDFWGRKIETGFEMSDPLRFIKTYDLGLKDIDGPLPKDPANNNEADWNESNKAAVSAHVNATYVYDFYNSILMRDGVDDNNMELVSCVNCTYSEAQNPPEWHNAVWYNNRMWYGQERDASGKLKSYSRFLDVIAHELTHGVTEFTSDLVYNGQSGALNESFSDIFGIIIKNWYEVGAESKVTSWNWELGAGLGQGELPLRDFSDPKRTNDPDHMDDYLDTIYDSGGVHTNSNIHNKAVYNVLTARDENGDLIFTAKEVAVLYYLTLQRLGRLANFSDSLEELVEVAGVYYASDELEREAKIDSIRKAYQDVGIA